MTKLMVFKNLKMPFINLLEIFRSLSTTMTKANLSTSSYITFINTEHISHKGYFKNAHRVYSMILMRFFINFLKSWCCNCEEP